MGIGLDWVGSGRIRPDWASGRGVKHSQAFNALFGRFARLGWIGPEIKRSPQRGSTQTAFPLTQNRWRANCLDHHLKLCILVSSGAAPTTLF